MPRQDTGAREVVQDPNAQDRRQPLQLLQTTRVGAPATQVGDVSSTEKQLASALGGIDQLVANQFEDNKARWITEGKMAYLSGKTEADLIDNGNRFTRQGYQTLKAKDAVNNWFTQESIAIDETHKTMDPSQYSAQVKSKSQALLDSMTDPDAKAVATSTLESVAPRLVQSQMLKNNEFNRGERRNSFSTMLDSTATTSASASVKQPGQVLALSPTPVEAPIKVSSSDRDTGIRTLLGEAANEGAEGMAAVAHVMRNRASDGRWPDTIGAVAKQPQQFSAWNAGAGGNDLVRKYNPGDPIYEKAGQVFDAVMAGSHVDPTGGATHYYSPAGMRALVAEGSQKNEVPTWLAAESKSANGTVKIGGHVFTGRANSAPLQLTRQPETGTLLSANTSADLNAVPGTEGVNVAPIAGQHGPNEVQDLIFGYNGLNSEDKATAVADAMRRQLTAGNDALFRDAGGIGTLQKLKAKPSEIDEVLKAKEAFEKKQVNLFSTDNEKFRNDILKRAERGESLDVILADIEKRHQTGKLDDVNSKALAHAAADKIRAEGDKTTSVFANTDFLGEIGGLYQQVKTGTDFQTAAKQAKQIAAKYGAQPEDVQRLLGNVFQLDQGQQDKLRTEAATAAKTKKEQDDAKDEVNRQIAKGYGLGGLTGTQIKITNDHGAEETVSKEQYGVSLIKDRWSSYFADQVNSGKMTVAEAKAGIVKNTYLELQKHGVIDEKAQAQITGALTGNILDKDGSLKPEAVQAYDAWLMLRTAPGMQDEGYLSKFIKNDEVRTLLETAYKLDSGDLSKEQALIKAHEIVNDKNRDPKDLLAKDAVWKAKMRDGLSKVLEDKASPGFLDNILGNYDAGDKERVLSQRTITANYITRRAEAYHLQNPNEDADVSLTKAQQDFKANATHVMGNIVIGRPGLELHKVMGVTAFGPNAVNDAVSSYIKKHGETLWGKNYTGQGEAEGPEGTMHAIARNLLQGGSVLRENAQKQTPVSITYNAELGIMSVDLYKDTDKGKTLGQPMHFNVRDIGAAYVKEKTKPSTWDAAFAAMFRGTVGAVKSAVGE